MTKRWVHDMLAARTPRALVPLAAAAAVLALQERTSAQESRPQPQDQGAVMRSGDMRRVDWVRPWSKATAAAKAAGKLMVVKPILGGSNTPDPDGIPCGGKNDCEGSW